MIDELGKLLADELLATATYQIQAAACANWGLHKLAAKLEEESGEERGHARKLADRMVLLGTMPAPDMATVEAGSSIPDLIAIDLRLESGAVRNYRRAIRAALEAGDPGTRTLLEEILHDEEGHQQWLESQAHLLHETGLSNYLTLWV